MSSHAAHLGRVSVTPCGVMRMVPRLWLRSAAGLMCLAALWVSATGQVLAAESSRTGAESLLRRCLKTQSATDRISARGVTEYVQSRVDPRPAHRVVFWFRRDGDLLDISGSRELLSKKKQGSSRFRHVVGPEICIDYNWFPARHKGPFAGVATENLQGQRVRLLSGVDYAACLDGYLPGSGGVRVAERLLAASDLRLRGTEPVGGVPCIGVEGTTPYGVFTMWIAQNKGCSPLKVACKKGRDDLIEPQTKVSQADLDPNLLKGQPPVGWSIVLDEVELLQKGDAHVAVGGRVTETWRLSGGRELPYSRRYKRTEAELEPNFKGTDAFVIDLPEGAPITNLDVPKSGVLYEWRGGKVVVATPGGIAAAEGFWGSGAAVARTIIASITVLALVGLAVGLYFRGRRRRA
jgi:hypothetical protein